MMDRSRRVIHSIFSLLFGEFNGIQVFLYPMTLFWWIDSDSFLYAITGLLTAHKHFFPLCLFLLLAIYIAFLILKNSSALLSDTGTNSSTQKRSLARMIIAVHQTLLITLIISALIYVVAGFLSYYYGIKVPLKSIYPFVFQAFSVSLILFYVLKNAWTEPYRSRGISMEGSVNQLRKQFAEHTEKYAIHAIVLVLMILISSFIYNLLIMNLFFPIVEALGFAPKLLLLPPSGIGALLYDVFIFGVAFMLSNLLFSPIVMVITHYSDKLHPHIQIQEDETEAQPN